MATTSLVRTFPADVTCKSPDPDKIGHVHIYKFRCKFKTYSQDEDTLNALNKRREEEGMAALLKEVLQDAEVLQPKDEKFTDAEGKEISAREFLCLDMIMGQDALQAFWDKVNEGILEKNSKKSRKR
jgi:hypothetical protein